MPKISIIVPVYNVYPYLKRCLDSLVNQTFKDIEIIIIDGQSQDGSQTIINEYAKRDKRIKAYTIAPKGLGDARNYGMGIASGEYIGFIDSDDYIEETMYEKMYNEMITSKADMVYCGFERVDDVTKEIYSREMISMKYNSLAINKNNLNELAFLSPSAWCKLYKRELIEGLQFPNNKMAVEDLVFFLKLVPRLKKVSFVKELLYKYTVRRDSLIFNTSQEKSDLFQSHLLEIKEEYKKKKYNQEYFRFLDLIVFIHAGISMVHRVAENKKMNLRKYINEVKKYMDINFIGWRKIRAKQTSKVTTKGIAIYILTGLYKINLFIVFIRIYNFMINKLKIDIKW